MEEETNSQKYVIPVQEECDVELACTGAIVDKATLIIGGNTICTIKLHNVDPKDITVLDFLGGLPLRMGLLNKGSALVTLYAYSGLPSLMMNPVSLTTYMSLGDDNLIEPVKITDNKGNTKTDALIYYAGDAVLASG